MNGSKKIRTCLFPLLISGRYQEQEDFNKHYLVMIIKLYNISQSKVINSVQFSRSVVSDSLRPHGLQHARLPCFSSTPRACLNSRSLRWLCNPTISSSVVPFSSCLHSFPTSGSFPLSQFFASGGQSITVSASISVLPMNTQD